LQEQCEELEAFKESIEQMVHSDGNFLYSNQTLSIRHLGT